MCRSLLDRGHDVRLAHVRMPPQDTDESVGGKAADIQIPCTEQFALDRYLHPLPTLRDLFALPSYLRREKFDVVHMHLCHDHSFGGACAKLLLCGKRPRLVRTLHRRDVLPATLGYRLQLRRLTDGWLTFTEGFRQQYIERFRLPADRVAVQPMTIDIDRFRPDKPWRDMRGEFGLPPGTPLIGIVGRFQKYRQMGTFLGAAAKVVAEVPEARFVIIGSSSKMQQTVVEPAKEFGISDKIIITGYRQGDYGDIMASLDIFSLLMPGFDGTARAVREAMALAKPCVVSDFGMLPDIVPHDQAGLVARHGDADSLAAAWIQLLRNPQQRLALGAGARQQAEARFRIDAVGPMLENYYLSLLGGKA